MRRAVEKYLEDPLAEELLRGNIKAGDTLEVTLDGTKLGFHVAERAGSQQQRTGHGELGFASSQTKTAARLFPGGGFFAPWSDAGATHPYCETGVVTV